VEFWELGLVQIRVAKPQHFLDVPELANQIGHIERSP
jgi:hypothetical protein